VPLQGTATAGSPAGGSPGSASAANADPSAAGTPNLTFNANAKPQSVRRANNWGLANTAGKTGAVTRPIRVSCLTDRLVVHPETGDLEQPQNVRFQQSDITADEMDRLVAVVQKRMQGWGMAGQNGYWKPILRVEVAPQAEERFAQFQSALQGSGYEVQRKTR
jgi:hypothetical protein